MSKQVRASLADSLRAEVARIQAAQERMNLANAALRAGDDAALSALGLPIDLVDELKQRYVSRGIGYPPYALRNNRSMLRLLRDRLKTLESPREATQSQAIA